MWVLLVSLLAIIDPVQEGDPWLDDEAAKKMLQQLGLGSPGGEGAMASQKSSGKEARKGNEDFPPISRNESKQNPPKLYVRPLDTEIRGPDRRPDEEEGADPRKPRIGGGPDLRIDGGKKVDPLLESRLPQGSAMRLPQRAGKSKATPSSIPLAPKVPAAEKAPPAPAFEEAAPGEAPPAPAFDEPTAGKATPPPVSEEKTPPPAPKAPDFEMPKGYDKKVGKAPPPASEEPAVGKTPPSVPEEPAPGKTFAKDVPSVPKAIDPEGPAAVDDELRRPTVPAEVDPLAIPPVRAPMARVDVPGLSIPAEPGPVEIESPTVGRSADSFRGAESPPSIEALRGSDRRRGSFGGEDPIPLELDDSIEQGELSEGTMIPPVFSPLDLSSDSLGELVLETVPEADREVRDSVEEAIEGAVDELAGLFAGMVDSDEENDPADPESERIAEAHRSIEDPLALFEDAQPAPQRQEERTLLDGMKNLASRFMGLFGGTGPVEGEGAAARTDEDGVEEEVVVETVSAIPVDPAEVLDFDPNKDGERILREAQKKDEGHWGWVEVDPNEHDSNPFLAGSRLPMERRWIPALDETDTRLTAATAALAEAREEAVVEEEEETGGFFGWFGNLFRGGEGATPDERDDDDDGRWPHRSDSPAFVTPSDDGDDSGDGEDVSESPVARPASPVRSPTPEVPEPDPRLDPW